MRQLSTLIFILLMAGCSRHEQKWSSIVSPIQENIRFDSVQLKRIALDSVYCSGEGFSGFTGADKICFFDSYYGYLFSFNLDGTFYERKYGVGNGPKEVLIDNPFGFYLDRDGSMALLGNGLDVELHPSEGKSEYFIINYRPEEKGSSSSYSTYTHSIMPDAHMRKGREVLYALFCENPVFNMLNSPQKYLKEAYHIAVVDTKTHEASLIVKGFPEIYSKDPHRMFSFSYVRYDYVPERDQIILGFEATPELYVCNATGKPLRVFGAPGRNMDQEYLPVRSFDPDEVKNHRKNRNTKGYYSTITVDGKWVFRSYKKGGNSPIDGLQIYEDEILVADLDVPKDFSVIGVHGNTVISNIQFDEETERLYCYEFELE